MYFNNEFQSEDYTHHFRTEQMWDTKEDLYSWAKETARALMIVLIKRSSNAYRISMVCERFGRAAPLGNNIVRKSTTKKFLCKFELLGVLSEKNRELDYESQRQNQKWILGVIEGRHNHRILKSLHGNAFMGRMTPEEKIAVRRWANGRKTPKAIVGELRIDFPGNVTSKKQVANFLQKLEYEDRGELNVTQWSLKFLMEHEYVMYPLKNTITNEVEILFFAHKESLHLLKKFSYVVVIDATYKSNK